MKIAVVGGGPSGLYFAMLVRKRRPDWSVVVLEQNTPDATFGFGVVLADSGLNSLRAADEESLSSLLARMTFTERQVITVQETQITVERPAKGGAIRRIDLLEVLQEAARAAGVDVRSGVRVDCVSDCAAHGLQDADIVVGADGVNSVVRTGNEGAFGTRRSQLTNRFAWFGVGKAFPNPALVFRKHEGGYFVAHYYPYTDGLSTFVAECDQATWERFGMEGMALEERKALFERVFKAELGGYPLLSNNSLWRQFPVIRNDHWVAGNQVLIGDAQTSAHFSIGSGTRIAIEDSIALAEAVCGYEGSVAEKLAAFVSARRPEKDKLISASERSYNWYEDIARWMNEYSPHEFVYRFMTRTGRVTDARLASGFPKLYAQLAAANVVPTPTET